MSLIQRRRRVAYYLLHIDEMAEVLAPVYFATTNKHVAKSNARLYFARADQPILHYGVADFDRINKIRAEAATVGV